MTLKLLGFAAVLMPLGQPGATGSTTVAVVSVATVSEKYARTGDLEERFKVMEDKFREERDVYRGRIERTTRSLQEELKPGTDAYELRRRELAMLEAEAQYFVESKRREIAASLARSLRSIFDDIEAAVREVALEKGVDIVLASDELPDRIPTDPSDARQQILLQKVLFWGPDVDLTDEVIVRLNAKYAAQQATSPSETGG